MKRVAFAAAAIAVGASLGLSGCAGLSVKTIDGKSNTETSVHGFRYYQPAPYLMVFTDNDGGLTSQIVYLTDRTKKMSVRPYAYLASNEVTLKFQDGMLTNASTTVDETIVPKAALDGLKDILTAAVKGSAFNESTNKQTTAPAPSLYKIVVDGGSIKLIGGQAEYEGKLSIINTGIKPQ